jgi:hypothetical protein
MKANDVKQAVPYLDISLTLSLLMTYIQSGQKMRTLFTLYFTCQSVYIFVGHSVYSGTSVHEFNLFLEAVREPKCS